MIDRSDICPVGKFLKPHGVNGEISILRDSDTLDFNDYSCVIVDIDGIFVPFFLESVRPKGAGTDLVTIEGISDGHHAASMTNKTVYVLRSEVRDVAADDEGEAEGFYAGDLIGYDVNIDGRGLVGKIIGIDDSTANCLFIIETSDGDRQMIPVADEFVTGVNPGHREISMELPAGLLEMQKG